MNEESWLMTLADSWLGKGMAVVVVLFAGAFGGWWTSRANIMNAVNNQVKNLMAHYVGEIKRLTEAHHACEERLHSLEEKVSQLTGERDQAKQTIDSMSRAKER